MRSTEFLNINFHSLLYVDIPVVVIVSSRLYNC